jgi:hypothetical protein
VTPDNFAELGEIRREPRAEMRTAAAGIRDMFLALLEQGFTEDHALRLVGNLIASQRGGQA